MSKARQTNLQIRFKRLRESAKLPERMTPGAAGYDLYYTLDVLPVHSSLLIAPGKTAVIRMGWAVELPIGVEMQIRPRSSHIFLAVANSPATIDSDYRGEVSVVLRNMSNTHQELCVGTRIAQAVFAKCLAPAFVEVAELSGTERGDDGFGSTGA